MAQTLSWMFLRVIWNKQTMIDTSSRSLCGEDAIWLVHLVTGEPLSKRTTYDICRHKRMLQKWSTYKKVTCMNKDFQVQRTDLQASHRATWNIYLEHISRTAFVVFDGTASQCLFRDQIQALTTTLWKKYYISLFIFSLAFSTHAGFCVSPARDCYYSIGRTLIRGQPRHVVVPFNII